MARRSPRRLSDEERALWEKVVDKATPMHPDRHRTESAEGALLQPETSAPTNTATPPRFRVGQTSQATPPAHDIAQPIENHVASQPMSMDRRRFTQMKRGRLKPDARLDLHGLTLAQAHPALTRFILDAVAGGQRLVLIITGKGKSRPDSGPIPERHGVLRHQVPHWLNSAPLKAHVLQITEAHVKHGGMGAYYVYLRRMR